MCGFISILSREDISECNKEHYLKIADKIKHRGPDDSHFYYKDNFLSIFHRLSIRDLTTTSRQPILSKCGRYLLTFNGEIYRHSTSISESISDYNSKYGSG